MDEVLSVELLLEEEVLLLVRLSLEVELEEEESDGYSIADMI